MPKLTLTFDLPEERSEASLAQAAGKLYSVCHDIAQYKRTLYKYDERDTLPKEEVIDKLSELLEDYYSLEDL